MCGVFSAILESIPHRCNPFMNDAPGYVYIVRRIRCDDYRRYHNRQISPAEYRAVSQVKVGHAKDFETRQRAYAKCGVDWVLIWEMKLWTPHRMLLGRCSSFSAVRALILHAEGLIHESLWRRNAAIPCVRCSCSKEHREFFDLVAAGGVDGVEKIALRWMYLTGQALTVKSVGYDAN
jgi:hypothetical protein